MKLERYIYKVLKEIFPDKGISQKGMQIMNDCMNNIMQKILLEASHLCRYRGAQTLQERDIRSAVRLVYPGELAQNAVASGENAMRMYKDSIAEEKPRRLRKTGAEGVLNAEKVD